MGYVGKQTSKGYKSFNKKGLNPVEKKQVKKLVLGQAETKFQYKSLGTQTIANTGVSYGIIPVISQGLEGGGIASSEGDATRIGNKITLSALHLRGRLGVNQVEAVRMLILQTRDQALVDADVMLSAINDVDFHTAKARVLYDRFYTSESVGNGAARQIAINLRLNNLKGVNKTLKYDDNIDTTPLNNIVVFFMGTDATNTSDFELTSTMYFKDL